MTLLDRSLVSQFIWIWVVCFMSLMGLYIIIDAFGNLEEFLTHADKSGANLAEVMGGFYSYRVIGFFDRTSGILTLTAAMFTLAGMRRFHEYTALLAAGIRPWRIIRAMVICGVLIAGAAALNRELVIPRYREHFSRTAQDLSSGAVRALTPRPDYWSGIIFRGRQLSLSDRTIIEPSLQLPRSAPREFGRYLTAQTARYEAATAEHPAGYRLSGVTQPGGLDRLHGWQLNTGEAVIFTSLAADWLSPGECFVASEVAFDLLVDPAGWRQYASTAELIAGLRRRGMDYGNDVRVTVHARLLQPVLDVVLLLLGLPLVMRNQSNNLFLAAGQCVLVVIGFLLVSLGCQFLGGSYLISPVLGAWLPLILFIPLAVFNGEVLWS